MRIPKFFVVFLLISVCLLPGFSQTISGTVSSSPRLGSTGTTGSAGATEAVSEDLSRVPEGRALLAMTTAAYPVTPGDVYTLAYLKATTVASQSLMVENDYRVNLGVFGILNARGQSFSDFKRRVEETVARAYPGSSPQLIIRSTGVFEVQVVGEVANTGLEQVWGLVRLSSLYDLYKTAYSSEREVKVRSVDGSEVSYDLFKARRDGDLSRDPYLRPGDRVAISNAQRRISISGEVTMPGTYQLLPGEELPDLISGYAKGLTSLAEASRIRIIRLVSSDSSVGESLYVDGSKNGGLNGQLQDRDSVIVSSRQEFLPIVSFEGAVGISTPNSGESADSPDVSNRVQYPFHPGTTLSTAVLALRKQFSAISDIRNAYLRRAADGRTIPVNLENFLHRYDFRGDLVLEPNDVIIVPFRQFFVSVSGSVYSPGRYPYVPDRSWAYYVSLAGGVNEERNNGRNHKVYNLEGQQRSLSDLIQPEDRIVIPANSFLYNFGRISTILTTTISVASLALGIIQLSR